MDRLAEVLRKRNPEAPIRLVFPPVSLCQFCCLNTTDTMRCSLGGALHRYIYSVITRVLH